LILDEPTSALDGENEATISETLLGLKGTVTMVIVAHRLSTLRSCDRILVIDGGRVTAFSDPPTLLTTSEYFRDSSRSAQGLA